jgi:hypothetical protein
MATLWPATGTTIRLATPSPAIGTTIALAGRGEVTTRSQLVEPFDLDSISDAAPECGRRSRSFRAFAEAPAARRCSPRSAVPQYPMVWSRQFRTAASLPPALDGVVAALPPKWPNWVTRPRHSSVGASVFVHKKSSVSFSVALLSR